MAESRRMIAEADRLLFLYQETVQPLAFALLDHGPKVGTDDPAKPLFPLLGEAAT